MKTLALLISFILITVVLLTKLVFPIVLGIGIGIGKYLSAPAIGTVYRLDKLDTAGNYDADGNLNSACFLLQNGTLTVVANSFLPPPYYERGTFYSTSRLTYTPPLTGNDTSCAKDFKVSEYNSILADPKRYTKLPTN